MVSLERPDHQDRSDPLEHLVSLVAVDPREMLDNLDKEESKVYKDPQE